MRRRERLFAQSQLIINTPGTPDTLTSHSSYTDSDALAAQSSLRLVVAAALCFALCLLSGAGFGYFSAVEKAQQHTRAQAKQAASQAVVTLQPLMLAEDKVAINVYLSTLSEASYLNGIRLLDERGKLLARAGSERGPVLKQPLGSEQIRIGELQLYTSDWSIRQLLLTQLSLLVLLSLATLVITLLLLWRKSSQLMLVLARQREPLFTPETSRPSGAELAIVDLAVPATQAEPPAETEQPAPAAQVADNSSQPEQSPAEAETSFSAQLVEASQEQSAALKPAEPDSASNSELVALLKPDNSQRGPQFTPSSPEPEQQPKRPTQAPAADIELEESVPTLFPETDESTAKDPEPSTSSTSNPLLEQLSREREEEQLDLYSLEHQLELSLPAEEAAYLILVDSKVNQPEELSDLEYSGVINEYRRLAKKLVAIYGGTLTPTANNDIQILFDQPDPHDRHGSHALCAAKLFNLLIRQFNAKRLQRSLPAVNLQIAIVRGNREKLPLLTEEARFLTRTTLSRELISHTALTEAGALKASILDGASTTREDEDKVLILRLGSQYQNLLQQQASYLLAKQ